MRAGQRVGNWFLWIDVDSVKVNGEPCVVVTAKDAICGGAVVNREFATKEMAKQLHRIANNIELALDGKSEF
jgi:hypothetical protein